MLSIFVREKIEHLNKGSGGGRATKKKHFFWWNFLSNGIMTAVKKNDPFFLGEVRGGCNEIIFRSIYFELEKSVNELF